MQARPPLPRRRLRVAPVAVAALATMLTTSSVEAWPKEAYRNMVYDTLRLLPPRLTRVLLKRDAEILRGVAALEGETAAKLARAGVQGQLSVELVEDVEARIANVARMVDEHRPFSETAYEFGRLLRIAADLADPTILGAGRPELTRVASEYLRFVDLNLEKLPLVHDQNLPSPLGGATVGALLMKVSSATSASVDPLSKAFWRDGRVVPASTFDYRSVPYAETSLSYSRGVTAASYLWLSAWSKANGDFTGYRFAPREH